MNARSIRFVRLAAGVTICVALGSAPAAAQPVRERYDALEKREAAVREVIAATTPDASAPKRAAVSKQARSVIAGYEALVRRFHGSGYADNALFNAAALADTLFERFNQNADRRAADLYYKRLRAEYPGSSLIKKIARRDAPIAPAPAALAPAPSAPLAPAPVAPLAASAPAAPSAGSKATLTGITRDILPEGVRITLALDREVPYYEEKLSGPARVFFDLKDVQTTPELRDVVLRYNEDAVRQIRVGRHPDQKVRVVLDLEGVKKHSVFTLYNPFRIVVDCEPVMPTTVAAVKKPSPVPPATVAPAPIAVAPVVAAAVTAPPVAIPTPAPIVPVVEDIIDPTPPPAPPKPPSSNTAGGFSLSRQLGLGISRVVIDPGHGGHDPGAQAKGLNEADLTLDVALRLEKLLREEGLEVVLTRRSNVYIPLEERTAIANRESADLFLSIHANASTNEAARGVETYFLSFAASEDAEAVAARENSASSGGMHNLPDIIKAIALNNKLDESKDFAAMVQEAMVSRLRRSNKQVRNLGVKKAPFVVLIGAQMPSVLAEISFLTNKQELQLLKTAAYKQRVAEALHASVMRYRRSLKGQGQVAERP